MLKTFYLPVLIFAVLCLLSCQSGEKKQLQQNSKDIESAQEQAVQLKINRFEMDLFSIPFDSVESAIPRLKAQYGAFLDIFSNKVINIGSTKKPDFPKYLKSFITDRYMYLTYQRIKEVYPDIHKTTKELEGAFNQYRELFPKRTIPHIYTLLSGYNQSIITADTILGISLDKYLGENCDYYTKLELPQYQRRVMSKDYIATDALRGWCYSEFLYNDSAENVLTNILYEGKIAYLLKELFPDKSDTIIFGYTDKQLEWCKSNIKGMWTYLVEHKLVFSTDYMTINKLVNPAPFTAVFTSESPGRAAVWLGYKIIDAYMDNNDVSLPELLKDENYQGILEKSKFKP